MTIPEELIKQGAKATGENWRDNYQSPRYILDKVDEFYGGNHLWDDPCPIAHTQDNLAPVILQCRALYFIGNLYFNPPFSQYSKWVDAYAGIQPTQQIWLLENVKTETKYGQKLLGLASAVCFLNKRVNFIHPETGKVVNGNRVGHLLIYLGDTSTHFKDVFKELGVVLKNNSFYYGISSLNQEKEESINE